MNAIAPREATAAEAEQAAAVYIPKAELDRRFALARAARAKEAARQKWRTRSFVGIIACLSAAVAAEGVALAALLPTVRVEPVFVEKIDELPQALIRIARDGDVIVTMGAGSIGSLAPELPHVLPTLSADRRQP